MQAITNRCPALWRAPHKRLATLRRDASDPRRHGAVLRAGAARLPGGPARGAARIGDPGTERVRAVLRAAVHAVPLRLEPAVRAPDRRAPDRDLHGLRTADDRGHDRR